MAKKFGSIESGGISKKSQKQLNEAAKKATSPVKISKEDETENILPLTNGFVNFLQNIVSGFWSIPLTRPYHRATSFQLAAANTFSSADLYDPLGPIIGVEKLSGGRAFTFDPWALYFSALVSSPNVLIEGSLRQGKSFFIKRLLCLLVEFGRYAINTSDAKGEHGVVAEALGGDVFKVGEFGSDVRINPLEASERRKLETEHEYSSRVKAARTSVLQQIVTLLNPGGRSITARESSIIDWAIDEVVTETDDQPTIRDVWQKIASPALLEAQNNYFVAADANDLRDGLRRLVHGDLAGMFDTHSTIKLRADSPYTVIDTFAINQRGEGALAVTQAITNAWVQNTISNKDSGRNYILIREEGWRDMKSVAALEAHQEQLKLSGEYGIAMVLIVHEGGDFDSVGPEGSKERELAKSLLRGYANRVCFNQPQSALRNSVKDSTYTQTEANAIGRLARGQFLVKLKYRSYVVDGNQTTTDWERNLFDTDRQMRARVLDTA